MKIPAVAYRPGGSCGPGALSEVELDVVEIRDSAWVMPGVLVADVRGGIGLDRRGGDLRFNPAGGGGPLASPGDRRESLAFGIVNVAYHLRSGLDYLAPLTGHALPPLIARIGAHGDQRPTWGGGHYRLPAAAYSSLPEPTPPAVTGEIHLGPGGAFTEAAGRRYFVAPAHVAAIVVHELGHTPDAPYGRLSPERAVPPPAQANHKIPLDERRSILMRKPIRIAMLVGTAGVIALGGTTAALAVHGNDQNHQTTASYNATPSASPRAPAKVSADQARQIAQQHVPSGTVTEIQLDHEYGQAVWEVYLTKQHREYEVYIDATTGKIIGGHHDRDLGDRDLGDRDLGDD